MDRRYSFEVIDGVKIHDHEDKAPKIEEDNNSTNSSDSTKREEKKLRKYIIENFIQPSYVQDVKDTLYWRFKWRKIGNVCLVIAKIVAIFSSLLSLYVPYLENTIYAVIGGSVGLLGVGLLQFSEFAFKEGATKTDEANMVLKALGIEGVPELDVARANNETLKTTPVLNSTNASTINKTDNKSLPKTDVIRNEQEKNNVTIEIHENNSNI